MTAVAVAEAATPAPVEARPRPAWSPAAVRVAWVLIALGALLRLRAYLHFRALWIDESLVALNVTHRSAGGLLHPLDYAQAAPGGWLLLERLMVNLFGGSEYSLRFVPFVGAVALLPLFYWLLRRLAGPRAGLIGLGLVSFSSYFIYYGAELKPYSTDSLVSVILLVVFVQASQRQWDARAVLYFSLTGAIAIWFAFTAVFVVGALSAFALITMLLHHRRSAAGRVAGGSMLWLASFAGSYLTSVGTTSGNADLQSSWVDSYLQIPPHSLHDVLWVRHIPELFRLLGRPEYASVDSLFQHAMIVVGLILTGLLIWRRRPLGLLFLAPLAVMLIASAAHKYPLTPRLMMFYVPFLALLIAVGSDELASRALDGRPRVQRRLIGSVGLVLLFALPVFGSVATAIHPTQTEEVRGVILKLRPQLEQGVPIVIYPAALPAFTYYSQRLHLRADIVGPNTIGDVAAANGGRPLFTDASVRAVVDPAMGKRRIWLFVSHGVCSRNVSDGQLLLSAFAKRGAVVIDTLSAHGAAAYLLDTRTHEGQSVPAFKAINPIAC